MIYHISWIMNRKMEFLWIMVVVLTFIHKPTVSGFVLNSGTLLFKTVYIYNGTDVMLVSVRNNYYRGYKEYCNSSINCIVNSVFTSFPEMWQQFCVNVFILRMPVHILCTSYTTKDHGLISIGNAFINIFIFWNWNIKQSQREHLRSIQLDIKVVLPCIINGMHCISLPQEGSFMSPVRI